MTRSFLVALMLGVSTHAVAQLVAPCLNDHPTVNAAVQSDARMSVPSSMQRSRIMPMMAYSNFMIGNDMRSGPALMIQYSPRRTAPSGFDFIGGIVFGVRPVTYSNNGEWVPIVARSSRFSQSFGGNRSYGSGMQLGLGYVGLNYTYYLLQGDFRPYVGAGAALLAWPYGGKLYGTIAPDVKAGLEIKLKNSLGAFAEVGHLFGMPNLVGPSEPRFNGATMVAVGFSFAPKLR